MKRQDVCVFAGSFDPITTGHKYIIDKCLNKYKKVLVVVGENPQKDCFFSKQERIGLLQSIFGENKNIEIVNYSEIKNKYIDYLNSESAKIYIRGIRDKKDLEYEDKMKAQNQTLYPFIQTEYIFCPKRYQKISSTRVKGLILSGEKYLKYIPRKARAQIKEIVKNQKIKK